jgi:nitrogen fixation protein FixH
MDVEIVGEASKEGARTLTEREAAAALNITDRQVRRLVKAGTLERTGAGRVTLASVEARLGRPVDASPDTHAEMVWIPVAALEHLMERAKTGDTLQLEHKATAEQMAALESERADLAKQAADLAADLEAERTRAAKRDAEQAAALEAANTKAEAAEREREQIVAKANEVIEREQGKAAQLAADLEAERSKGFWARLFGGKP